MTESVETKMQKAVDSVHRNLATIRTGRANPDILKRLKVDYYGSMVPIQQVANLSAPEPKMLQVQVYDRSAIKSVEKAIQKSDLGLTPNTDGNIIRLILPDLTEERRNSLEKVVRKVAEEGRVSVRNVRRDEMDILKKLEKDKEISEDEKRRKQEDLQEKTDKYVKMIDEMASVKEKDLHEI